MPPANGDDIGVKGVAQAYKPFAKVEQELVKGLFGRQIARMHRLKKAFAV